MGFRVCYLEFFPFLVVWLYGTIVTAATTNCSLQVETTSGPIIGKNLVNEGYLVDAFQGIPYAKPPVGELRFKKPVAPEPWTTPRETKAFGKCCIQPDNPRLGNSSEDCLTLNVFTPASRCSSSAIKYPVIFFIHGGAFKQDSVNGYGDVVIGKNVVSKDIVVVGVDYRLGFLGFWSTGDVSCPGNNALWDLTLALKWVKENIAKFGGDPDNVTVLGQSAGGALADFLSISPHSRDLFQRIICMAGTASMDWALSFQTVETSRRMAEELGVTSSRNSTTFLAELRQVPADRFKKSQTLNLDDPSETLLGPRFDGDFFPKQISELMKEAPIKPRIIGQTRNEGLFFGVASERSEGKPTELEKIAARLFPERNYLGETTRLRTEFANRILNDTLADAFYVRRYLAEAFGDKSINMGTLESANYWSERGAKVFLYVFDHFNPEMYGMNFGPAFAFKDATHTDDIALLFGTALFGPYPVTEADRNVTSLWSNYITNFSKTGNPNGPTGSTNATEWLPMTVSTTVPHLRISPTPTMNSDFFHGRPAWILRQRQQFFRRARGKQR